MIAYLQPANWPLISPLQMIHTLSGHRNTQTPPRLNAHSQITTLSLTLPHPHLLTLSPTHSFTHSLTHSHSLIHSLAHSLTHSHSLTHHTGTIMASRQNCRHVSLQSLHGTQRGSYYG